MDTQRLRSLANYNLTLCKSNPSRYRDTIEFANLALEAAALLEQPAAVGGVPAPDWTNAPEWAMWWAVDPNGWASWYQEEPVLHITVSYSGWIQKTVNGVEQGGALWAKELDIPLGIDWRTLKQRRPIVSEYLADALKDVPAIKAGPGAFDGLKAGPDDPRTKREKPPKLKQQRPPAAQEE